MIPSYQPIAAERPATVNIHHLELFYHVVPFGGITAAARQMPYGIQQAEEILGLDRIIFHGRF